MCKVAAKGPASEQHHCGRQVIRAMDTTGRVVFLDQVAAGAGRMALQLDLAGGLPIAARSERRTQFKRHSCPRVA